MYVHMLRHLWARAWHTKPFSWIFFNLDD